MKILLIGCSGLLGQNLLRTAPDSLIIEGAGLEPEPALPENLQGYAPLDISVAADIEKRVKASNPDFIINAAAYTDVDGCERNPSLSHTLNRDAVASMAATGVPMLQVSSDYVFDGENGPYAEEDDTHPLSVYGQDKLASETPVLSGNPNSLVVRTMTLWGRGRGMKTSFVDFVKGSLEQGKPIRIVTDQFGNPTLAEDLAQGIWKLITEGHSGLFHLAGSEWNSRFEWAVAIAQYYGLDASLIEPCLTADLRQLARRPLKSGFRIDKLVHATGFRPGNVVAQLQRVQAPD